MLGRLDKLPSGLVIVSSVATFRQRLQRAMESAAYRQGRSKRES
jgi:hypothetical protein